MTEAFKCPQCGETGWHKFSCSQQHATLAQHSGSGSNWRDYRSSGYVAQLHRSGLPSYFDTTLVSHVVDNLWQGGCTSGVNLGSDFSAVVSLYPWERYLLDEGVDRVEVKMYDSPEGILFEDLVKASDAVLDGLKKGPTLVHCQAGLNRSGLVAAFTLMRLGYTAQDAIDLLRRSRDKFVLCNETFVKQLHELQHRFEDEPEFANQYRVKGDSNA